MRFPLPETPAVASLLVAATLSGPAALASITVIDLGVLPGGTSSWAGGVSADGSTVTGYSSGNNGNTGFSWTSAGTQSLATLPGSTGSRGAATNGSVTVGAAVLASGYEHAVRWSSTGPQVLQMLSGGLYAEASGVSHDGQVIAGTSHSSSSDRAVRWTASGIQDLGVLPGASTSYGYALSGDGQVVAGASSFTAFRWDASTGMQSLGKLAGGGMSFAYGANLDGSVIVGASDSFEGTRGFRWTASGGMQSLGSLNGGYSIANATNADGSIIVGYSGFAATIWTASSGLVDLNSYLVSIGADMNGWNLREARSISADGNTITGWGSYNGEIRGWVVSVPAPGVACVMVTACAAARRRRR